MNGYEWSCIRVKGGASAMGAWFEGGKVHAINVGIKGGCSDCVDGGRHADEVVEEKSVE